MRRNLSKLNLSHMGKLSVMRLAVDLIKADNQIAGEEVSVLTDIQEQFGLTQEDVDGIHYITLQQAVEALKDVDAKSADEIASLLNDIMCVDNDIDYDENILMTSVKMSLSARSRSWCKVISVSDVMDETSLKQIMYLESSRTEAVHEVFDDKYDKLIITKAFNDLGLDFFYLPDAIESMSLSDGLEGGEDDRLLRKAMKYLVPSASISQSDKLEFNPDEFFYFILSRYNIDVASLDTASFLLLKIRDSYYLDDDNNLKKAVDFFVMDISSDVRKRIYAFVSNFSKRRNQISYVGCYKILCDYLSSEAKTISHIILDDRFEFRLKDAGRTLISFESSPQARTFYLLLLKYGEKGLSQQVFEDAADCLKSVVREDFMTGDGNFDILTFLSYLERLDTQAAAVIYNTIVIYSAVSTKDSSSLKFLDYIEKIFQYRSALKHYINKGFAEIGKLAASDSYSVLFDTSMKIYRSGVLPSRFLLEHEAGELTPLHESELWKRLL